MKKTMHQTRSKMTFSTCDVHKQNTFMKHLLLFKQLKKLHVK